MTIKFIEAQVPGATRIDAETVEIPPLSLYKQNYGLLVGATVCYDLCAMSIAQEDRREIMQRIVPGWNNGRAEQYDLATVERNGRYVITMYCDDGLTAAFVRVPVDPRDSILK